ncbi:MAG: uroporphyrinogen decarboxylase family protein [Candidatus Baldrarchaeia archaeon]
MQKTVEELYRERLERFEKAAKNQKPDRVPFMPAFTYFPARYAGITYHEYSFNYNKFVEAVLKVYKDFDFDLAGFVAPGTGIPGPLGFPIIFVREFPELLTTIPVFAGPAHDILGDKYTKWPGRELDVNKPSQIAYVDAPYMTVEEYRELAENPVKFLIEKIVPRVYRNLSKPGTPQYIATLVKLGMESLKFGAVMQQLVMELRKIGYPMLPFSFSTTPLDYIGDNLRCPHNYILVDIHRVPEDVKSATEALLPYLIELGLKAVPPPEIRKKLYGTELCTIFIPLHLNEMLSPKLYNEFYWPYLKKQIVEFHKAGLISWVFFEGDHTPHLETLLEVPKGSVIAYFEKTDLRKAREVLGDHVVIMGGLPPALLVLGTPEKVYEEACKLLNDVKEPGGFIMAGSGVTGIPDETKPENLRALIEAVKKCGTY